MSARPGSRPGRTCTTRCTATAATVNPSDRAVRHPRAAVGRRAGRASARSRRSSRRRAGRRAGDARARSAESSDEPVREIDRLDASATGRRAAAGRLQPPALLRQQRRAMTAAYPDLAPAPHPRHRVEPRAAPRDRADPGRPDLAAVRHRGRRASRSRSRTLPGVSRWSVDGIAARAQGGASRSASPASRCSPTRRPDRRSDDGARGAQPRQPDVPRDPRDPRRLRRATSAC